MILSPAQAGRGERRPKTLDIMAFSRHNICVMESLWSARPPLCPADLRGAIPQVSNLTLQQRLNILRPPPRVATRQPHRLRERSAPQRPPQGGRRPAHDPQHLGPAHHLSHIPSSSFFAATGRNPVAALHVVVHFVTFCCNVNQIVLTILSVYTIR